MLFIVGRFNINWMVFVLVSPVPTSAVLPVKTVPYVPPQRTVQAVRRDDHQTENLTTQLQDDSVGSPSSVPTDFSMKPTPTPMRDTLDDVLDFSTKR